MNKVRSAIGVIWILLFMVSCRSSADDFVAIIEKHEGNEYPISNRKIALCQVQGSEIELKLPLQCTLSDQIATTDEEGNFKFSDVSTGMYVFLYDSGLGDFDESVNNWAGKQITIGNSNWIGSAFQGNNDGSVNLEVFNVNALFSIMTHCENDFAITYLVTHMIVPESPFILAHDVESTVKDCQLHIITAFMPPMNEEQTIAFPALYLGEQNAVVPDTDQTQEVGNLSTPQLIGTKQYSSAPPMLIDTSKKYTALVTMANGGMIEIELYADRAPITVNSFVFLARQGYFDGVTFHRVLENFMAQGGDPTGTGGGGPGYEFEYEDSGMSFDKAGVVAMANTGPATPTNGSQFFITFGPTPHLDGGYTIFGQVVSGMDVINGLTLRDPNSRPDYEGDVIESITITEE